MATVATRLTNRSGTTYNSSQPRSEWDIELRAIHPITHSSRAQSGLKMICVGAAATGKTTFLRFWEKRHSALSVRTTIGVERHNHEMDIYLPAPDAAAIASAVVAPRQAPAANRIPWSRDQEEGGAYRLIAPTVRTDYGPGTECQRVMVSIWDIQGAGNSFPYVKGMLKCAVCALVFCDLSSHAHTDSLENAMRWKLTVDNNVRMLKSDGSGEHSIPCWLVVNKYDLIEDAPIGSCPPWATRQMLDQFVVKHNFVGWSYASGLRGTNVVETVSAALSRATERFPEEIRNAVFGAEGNGAVRLYRQQRPDRKVFDCCS